MNINDRLIKHKLNTDQRNQRELLFIVISVSIGIFLGSVIYMNADELIIEQINELFLIFNQKFSETKPLTILSGLISEHLTYLLTIILFSTSILATPAIHIATVIKSSGIGFFSAYLYCNFALKGLEYCLLIFYPSMVIFIVFMLTASKASLSYNKVIKQGSAFVTKTAIINLMITVSFLLLSCLVESVLIISFSSLFSFQV